MEDSEELQAMIDNVVQTGGSSARPIYDRYKALVTRYQEQPQLLDGCLEAIVQPLSTLLRQLAMSITAQDTCRVQDLCRLLYVLVSVRGYKTVVRFFPHEAADLERVLQVLGYVTDQRSAATDASAASSSTPAVWEAQAVLMLWLSILVLTPFDLVILDSEVTGDESSRAAAQQGYPPLAGKIMSLCQGYLQHPGAVREMAALLLARLLTRPDMSAALAAFLSWQQAALEQAAGPAAVFLLPGVLQVLGLIFKLGRREQLLPLAPVVWQQLGALLDDDGSSSNRLGTNALARKLAVKLAQRVGLVLLPPQLAGWRYVRAAADLGSSLGASPPPPPLPAAAATATATATEAQDASGSSGCCQQQQSEDQALEVPAEIEEVLGVLLGSCSDRDTVVRWSAAKGVGRLAACLPQQLAEEVVDGALALLAASEPDSSWHGGCLAIAEFARRSILAPARLPQVTQLLQQALAYDVRRGPHSVGSHVRDAAAYVCWALARAYDPCELQDCVQALASSLLLVACFDREVNCRRAAASAFQESVGRLGSFPHGLEILAVADYYSVGSISSAYLRVAPFIAQYEEYTEVLVQHLVTVKLRHWDKAIRALAAMGLAALAPVAAGQLQQAALPQLLQLVTADVLEVRTGAVLGIAELLPALAAAGVGELLCPDVAVAAESVAASAPAASAPAAGAEAAGDKAAGGGRAVLQVLSRLECAGMYRGKGGELMREAAARLVEQVAVAVAGLPVVPLVAVGPSKRLQAEQDLQQQQAQQSRRQSAAAEADGDTGSEDDAEDEDDAMAKDKPAASSRQQQMLEQQQQRRRLRLPLIEAYHASALRLVQDCLSHVQNSIQAGGVAALKAHAAAFQDDPEQRPVLQALVRLCCSRLQERDVVPAARRGAAAALGVLPAGLLSGRAAEEEVLTTLAAVVQTPLDPIQGFDIETRIAAVNSLSSLSLELLTAGSTSSSTSSSAATPGSPAPLAPAVPIAVLRDVVCPSLLRALEDYTRDDRGDVGSWVREAAMEGLTQLVLLLGSLHQNQEQQQQQQQQQQGSLLADAAAVLAQGAAGLRLQQHQDQQQQDKQQQAGSGGGSWLLPAQLQQLHQRLCLLVVSGLLRQSLERIARLRESALLHLASLLTQPATAAAVPGAAAIAAALPGDAAELAGVVSLTCVAKLGGLLWLPWYRLPLLEGLVASIGGVDASLAKAAAAALLAQVGFEAAVPPAVAALAAAAAAAAVIGAAPTAAAAAASGGEGAAAEQQHKELRQDVAKLLLQMWQQEAGSARLSLPLIKTAALLITHAGFAELPAPPLPPAKPASAISSSRNNMDANGSATTEHALSAGPPAAAAAAAAAVAPIKGAAGMTAAVTQVKSMGQEDSSSSSSAAGSTFAACVLQLLKAELRGCADVPKLLEGAALMAQLACVPQCSEAAIQSVMVLLVNRFPKVRRHMAEQLYVQVLAVQAEGPSDPAEAASCTQQTIFAAVPVEDLESALDVLLVSAWDGPLQQVRESREELAAHLHIEIRTRKLAKASQGGAEEGQGSRALHPAEHETYQSLLDDAARGGGY